jgi:hypothetical protein
MNPEPKRCAVSFCIEVTDSLGHLTVGFKNRPVGRFVVLCAPLLYQSACRITTEFLNKAQRYDPAVSRDELFKASRSVWCMVAFQLQLNRPLAFSDSMLGYNMLYPYTDDLVDCNDASREAKNDFAHIFHGRLVIGESNYDPKSHFDGRQSNVDELQLPPSLQPFADRARKIFDMVKLIENDWIRDDEHNGVYMSLATIHECQMKSTLQHARPDDGYAPKMAEIVEISAQEGGASVGVAGFLIEGQLTRAKMAYLEYLGFGLQLIDDLQVGWVISDRLEQLYSIYIFYRII